MSNVNLMIKRSVQIFCLTAALMALCCGVTYWSILRFAPYVYAHGVSEFAEITFELSMALSDNAQSDSFYVFQVYTEIMEDISDDEFVLHMFDEDGNEVDTSNPTKPTGLHIDDFQDLNPSEPVPFCFSDSSEIYTVLIAQNTKKESQVVDALHKALPLLSIAIFMISVITAFIYTLILAKPLKTIKKLQDDIELERQLELQRSTFFSAASHELKTPITIIKGQLQGMICKVGRYQDCDTYLAQCLRTTESLEETVLEILTISRLDSPGYSCKMQTVDLSCLVNRCLSEFQDLFLQKGLLLETQIESNLLVSGDPGLLRKAVDNLFSNAAAYSPSENQVNVVLQADDESVHLSVENTGVFIPDESISRLFEPFYRVEQSRNRLTGGSGLGLYLVKTILELHGAAVQIQNTESGVLADVFFEKIST